MTDSDVLCVASDCEYKCCLDDVCGASYFECNKILIIVMGGILGLFFGIGIALIICKCCSSSRQATFMKSISQKKSVGDTMLENSANDCQKVNPINPRKFSLEGYPAEQEREIQKKPELSEFHIEPTGPMGTEFEIGTGFDHQLSIMESIQYDDNSDGSARGAGSDANNEGVQYLGTTPMTQMDPIKHGRKKYKKKRKGHRRPKQQESLPNENQDQS